MLNERPLRRIGTTCMAALLCLTIDGSAAWADEPTSGAQSGRDQAPVEDKSKPPSKPTGARTWGSVGSVPIAPGANTPKLPISRPDAALSKAPGAERGPLRPPVTPASQLPPPAIRGQRAPTPAPYTPPPYAPPTNTPRPEPIREAWPTTAPSGPMGDSPAVESFPIDRVPAPAPINPDGTGFPDAGPRQPGATPPRTPSPEGYYPAPAPEWDRSQPDMAPRDSYPAPAPSWDRSTPPGGGIVDQGIGDLGPVERAPVDTAPIDMGPIDMGPIDTGFPDPTLAPTAPNNGMPSTDAPFDDDMAEGGFTDPAAGARPRTPDTAASLAGNKIDRIRKQHNLQTARGDLALRLDLRFTTRNQAGREVFVALWFLDRESGERLQSADPAFADMKGALTAQSQAISVAGSPAAYDSTLLVPYRAFPQLGAKPSYEIETQALLLRREPSGMVLVLATGSSSFRVYGSGANPGDAAAPSSDADFGVSDRVAPEGPSPDDGMEDWSIPVPTEFTESGPPPLPTTPAFPRTNPRRMPPSNGARAPGARATPPSAPIDFPNPDTFPTPGALPNPNPGTDADAFSNPSNSTPKAPIKAPTDGLPPPAVNRK